MTYITWRFVELLLCEEQVKPPLRMTHEVMISLVRPPPERLPHLPCPFHRLPDWGELLPPLLLTLQRLLDGVHHLAELKRNSVAHSLGNDDFFWWIMITFFRMSMLLYVTHCKQFPLSTPSSQFSLFRWPTEGEFSTCRSPCLKGKVSNDGK